MECQEETQKRLRKKSVIQKEKRGGISLQRLELSGFLIKMGGISAQIDELRREVARLREEMKELGQHVRELERTRK